MAALSIMSNFPKAFFNDLQAPLVYLRSMVLINYDHQIL